MSVLDKLFKREEQLPEPGLVEEWIDKILGHIGDVLLDAVINTIIVASGLVMLFGFFVIMLNLGGGKKWSGYGFLGLLFATILRSSFGG